MTWEGLCPTCREGGFILTVNSDDDVHVNCANPDCDTYIGKMIHGTMLHPPIPEEH